MYSDYIKYLSHNFDYNINQTGSGVGSFLTKWFFITIIICTLAFLSLQIRNDTFDKKYVVSLLVIFVFALCGGLFITKLRGSGPYGAFIILKILFLGGPLITMLVLLILLGANKF